MKNALLTLFCCTLLVQVFSTPSNDDICDAIHLGTVPAGGSIIPGVNYDNIGAGLQAGEPTFDYNFFQMGSTVWFSFVAPAAPNFSSYSHMTIKAYSDPDNLGDEVNLALAVYEYDEGCDFSSLVEIGNDGEPLAYNEFLSLSCLTPGQTYYLQVGGLTDNIFTHLREGYFQLEIIGENESLPQVTSMDYQVWSFNEETFVNFYWDINQDIFSAGSKLYIWKNSPHCRGMEPISLSDLEIYDLPPATYYYVDYPLPTGTCSFSWWVSPNSTLGDCTVIPSDYQCVKVCKGGRRLASEEEHPLSLYPNPATNHVSLSGGGVRFANAQADIMDLAGRMVLSTQLGEDGTKQLDISTLDKGVYLLRILAKDGKQETLRLVKAGN